MFVSVSTERKMSGDAPQIITDANQLPQSICCGNTEAHCLNENGSLCQGNKKVKAK